METNKYDVTIGIPMYNAADFIQRTMESALSQTYDNIEFLVVDDGSTDNSVQKLNTIKDSHPRGGNIRLITLPDNQGPSYARNLIIEKAQGDYLYFMDSDDVIRKDTIDLMMRYVRQEQADIVFGSLEKIGLSGERTLVQYPELHFSKGDEIPWYSYRKYAGIQASACNFLARLSIIRENGLRFFPSNYWEDFAFVLDLVTYYDRAVLLPDITYTYLCRINSLSNFQNRTYISKAEINRNIAVVRYMKSNSLRLRGKSYYPQRCYVSVMTAFYLICSILKHRKSIKPEVTYEEMKEALSHPASLSEILSFKQCRNKNLMLFLIGKMPPSFCVSTIWIIGKVKKLI